ncbi:MAG: glycosyltransferase family 39 protein [Planctomycetaceae bacterium]|nr:glycosyltransferase family 39 protein [Planctomycetaceae bacterium]
METNLPIPSARAGVQRHYWLLLSLITLFAFGLRLAVTEFAVGLSAEPHIDDGLDQLDYESLAYRLSRGEGYTLADGTPTARRAPGTSLTILPIYAIFGRSYLAARIWFCWLSALTCLAAAQLLRRSCGEWAALLAAAGLAIDPGHFYYAIHLWSEAPFCLAVTLATWLTIVGLREGGRVPGLVAGCGWAFAILLRPQTILLAPLAVLVVIIVRGSARDKLLKQIALQGSVVAALVVPWVGRNAVVIGKPCLATIVGGFTFYGAHNDATFHDPTQRGLWVILPSMSDAAIREQPSEIDKERIAWSRGIALVRENWTLMPWLTVAKLYRLITPFEETSNRGVYWAFAVSWLIMVPLSIMGLRELRQRDPWLWGVFIWQGLAVLASVVVFYGAARFRHVLDPFLIATAALGLQVMARLAGATRKSRRRCFAPIAAEPAG